MTTPLKGICTIYRTDDTHAYRIECECTCDSHGIDAWVEVDRDSIVNSVEVTFFTKTHMRIYPSLWSRIKYAMKLLFTGDICQEHSILMDSETTHNFISAMTKSLGELRGETDK